MGKSRNIGKSNPFYGKRHTEKQKRRWSEQRKGHGASRFSYIPPDLTKERLDELYLKLNLSRAKISALTGYSDWIIERALDTFGIPKRSRSEIMAIEMQTRPLPKGGRLEQDGYILILQPTHHRANSRGYVWEHILVWEQTNGRPLPDGWIVHHINGKKSDNRPGNLLGLPRKSHHGYLLLQAARKRIRELENKLEGKNCQLALGESNAKK